MTDTDTAAASQEPASDGWEWAIVEIMGHRKHAGRVREEERFGAKMLRIDVPNYERKPHAEGEPEPEPAFTWNWVTHYYGGSSIFSFTLTDEDSVMRANMPWDAPGRYRLPAPEKPDFSEVDQPDDDSEYDDG